MNLGNSEDILRLQNNLQTIRKVAGWTTEELGERIGVTKQTISNLENKKTEMTKTQYIALRTILDYEIVSNPDSIALARVIGVLLDTQEEAEGEKENNDDMGNEKKESESAKNAEKKMAAIKAVSSVSIMAGSIALAATATGWLDRLMKDKK